MGKLIKVAVDAMGGDYAPSEIVNGAVQAAKELGVEIMLVGVKTDVDAELAKDGEVKAIISDLQGKTRIEYKTYPALKEKVLDRFLEGLPYMKKWLDFKKSHRSYVSHALKAFREIRTSGRTTRGRVRADLEGTGIGLDDLLGALRRQGLLSIRTGRTGGIYYPTK